MSCCAFTQEHTPPFSGKKVEKMDADIIVVGASPAGLMAARNACEKGSSVLLLEKKRK